MLPEYLSSAIESSSRVIVFSLDKNYRYTAFSSSHFQTMKKIWGVEIELGANLVEILNKINKTDAEKAKANFDRALSGESFTTIEEYGDEHIQRIFWEDRYDPIYDPEKQVVGVVVLVLEVSDRMELLTTVRETNQRLSLALNAAQIGIWEWNMITNEVVWSDEILEIYSLDESYRQLSFEKYLTYIHPDDLEKLQADIATSLKNNSQYYTVHRVILPDGTMRWISGTGKVITEDGHPVKMIGTAVDITERKKMEEANRAQEQALTHRDFMLSALAEATSQLAIEPDIWVGLQKALEILGTNTGVDRVYVFQNKIQPDGMYSSIKLEWNSGEAAPQIANARLQDFPFAAAPSLYKCLVENRAFKKHVRDIVDTDFREVMKNQQIKSVIMLPVQVQNQFWGFIGIDECKTERQITEAEYSIIKSFAITVGALLEQKQFERENKDWQTRYEIITASSGQVIYDYDIESGQIIWSGNVNQVLGYEPTEMGNIEDWGKMLHPEDHANIIEKLDASQSAGTSFEVEYRYKTKLGEYVLLLDRGFFLKDENQKIYRMLGIMSDISKQKKAEQDLKESENRFRILQEASFGGIGLHYQGEIMDANKGLSDLTGYSFEELIGMNGLNLVAPECIAEVKEKITAGYDKPYDVIGIRKDRTRYNLEIHGRNIPYREKVIRVTEFRDITDRKQNEQKILEQNDKLTLIADDLKRKNEQLDEFTQIVSHNLRSPVSNIISLLDFYEKSSDEKEKISFITMLREASTKMSNSLHELNEVLKIKQNKDIAHQELLFENVLANVKQQLNIQIADSKVIINTDFSVIPLISYPNIYLESIFMNLLSNAIKYRSPDQVSEISFSTRKENEKIILKVSDNGLGIDLKKYGHHVFKLRKTFHKHPESRGIGLFMIKNQIESLGGEISIESAENIGTTFTIKFIDN